MDRDASPRWRPVCDHCGEVIGVYEPVVWVLEGTARLTSRAATPELSQRSRRGRVHHVPCHRRASAGGGAADDRDEDQATIFSWTAGVA